MTQKIMFFTTGMSAGGAERVIATMATSLASRGFKVLIATVKDTGSAYDLGPNVTLLTAGLAPGLKNLPSAMRFYRRIIRQECPNVVASFSIKSDIIALLSKMLFRLPVRLVVSDRADPFSRDHKMQRACNFFYRRADAIVCQSNAVAKHYRIKCPKIEISVIPNPLNEDAIGVVTSPSREPLVITIGRLTSQKNHALAIRAFSSFHKRFRHFSMKIYGVGPLEKDLEDLIESEGMRDNIELAGVIPNVMSRHKQASIFLFTSNYEGYPNAVLEASATGVPVVSTDFSPGTARDIVQNGVNGYIVPVADEKAILDAMFKVMSGHLDAEDLKAAALHVRQAHRIDYIVDSWLNILRPGAVEVSA